MKRKYFIVLYMICLSPFWAFSQNHEIITLFSKSFTPDGGVFQFKYEQQISGPVSFQTGLRYHRSFDFREISGGYYVADESYVSRKIDFSVLVALINTDRFKLKAGIGLDAGFSDYTFATDSVYRTRYDMEYWRSDLAYTLDIGAHAIVQCNYYFKNNLFVTAQFLYNKVFGREVEMLSGNYTTQRKSPISAGLGVGFRF
jgi:hypothetical protein